MTGINDVDLSSHFIKRKYLLNYLADLTEGNTAHIQGAVFAMMTPQVDALQIGLPRTVVTTVKEVTSKARTWNEFTVLVWYYVDGTCHIVRPMENSRMVYTGNRITQNRVSKGYHVASNVRAIDVVKVKQVQGDRTVSFHCTRHQAA